VNCTLGITLEAIMKKISALLLLSAIALSGCSAIGTTSGVVTSDPVSAGKL
jgi:predicted small secreted protein